jgi:hypothetical protein
MTLADQIKAYLLVAARQSASWGSFKEIVSPEDRGQITYQFPWATGMAWNNKKSAYVNRFGDPPKWVKLLHPSHRVRICDLSIVSGQPLPEAMEGAAINFYLAGGDGLGGGQTVAKIQDMKSVKVEMQRMKKVKYEARVTEFEVNSSGTITMADFWERKIRSEFYESVCESWSESPVHLAEAMDDCEPLAWAVHSTYTEFRDEIQTALDEISETSGLFKKRTAALKARLKAMPEEPQNGVKAWLLALTANEFEERIVPDIKEWFASPPNWTWEVDHLPRDGTAQGAALEFFQGMNCDALDALGVTIVEGEHPGSTYYAAELTGDVDVANKAAVAASISVRFKKRKG